MGPTPSFERSRLRPTSHEHLPRALLVSVLAASLLPTRAAAQTLTGRVLEEGSSAPVPGAVVSLIDREGERRAGAMADSLGRFAVTPPEGGEYVIEASALGYETTRSPLIALELDGRASFEILIQPLPVGLEGFEVSVEREAERLIGMFGLTPTNLGRRWITRADMEEMPLPLGPGHAIRWRNLAGISVAEGELCVMFRRGRRGIGKDQCALVVLNGIRIDIFEAARLDALDLEAIAVLTPVEATTFFGTGTSGGAVLMWTRTGGRWRRPGRRQRPAGEPVPPP